MPKWKVTDNQTGMVYRNVEAPTIEEAEAKMSGGPPTPGPLIPRQGQTVSPLAPPAAPETQAPGTTVPSTLGQMRQDMLAHGLTEADVRQGQNAMTSVPGAQVVLKPGMQQGPLTPPAAPPAQPPGFQQMVEHGGMNLSPGAGKTEKGFFQRTPTGQEVAQAAVPLAMGMAVPPGRTITRGLASLLGNILGGAGVGAGAEMMKPNAEQDILGAAVQGGAKGVLPGIVQGGIGQVLGPGRATIQTQKAIEAVKSAVSPEVAAKLDASEPATFFSRMTTKAMKRAAGDNLDEMEADIGSALKGRKFPVFTTPGRPNPTFDEIRARIKDLRDVGDLAFTQDPVARKTARDSLAQASILERDMLSQMPKDLAAQYMQAMKQHAVDMDAVRFVRGQQARQQIAGGVNPFDNPELGKAERALSPLTGSQVLHGAVGAAEAATGRGLGAMYHLGQAVRGTKQKYAGKVAETAPSGPLAKRLSVPNLVGMLGGTGTSAGQSYISGSTEE